MTGLKFCKFQEKNDVSTFENSEKFDLKVLEEAKTKILICTFCQDLCILKLLGSSLNIAYDQILVLK